MPSSAAASAIRAFSGRWGAAARAAAMVSAVSCAAPLAATSRPIRARRAAHAGAPGSGPRAIAGSTGSWMPKAASSSRRIA